MSDWSQDPKAQPFIESVKRDLVPMIRDSAASVTIVSEGDPDVKLAVELGMSMLLNKPIFLAVTPGAKVPDKLALVADHILEFDPRNPGDLAERLQALIKEL